MKILPGTSYGRKKGRIGHVSPLHKLNQLLINIRPIKRSYYSSYTAGIILGMFFLCLEIKQGQVMKDKWNLSPSYKWKEMRICRTGALLGDKWGVETHVGRPRLFVLTHRTSLIPGTKNKWWFAVVMIGSQYEMAQTVQLVIWSSSWHMSGEYVEIS